MEKEKLYPIKVVSRKTGISLHVIRAWEKRYQVVEPERTGTNRRLYSVDDVRRLRLLKIATDNGYNIGSIAEYTTTNLEELVYSLGIKLPSVVQIKNIQSNHDSVDPELIYEKCMEAIKLLDAESLENVIIQASVTLSQPILIEKVVIPVVIQTGELWHSGKLRVMHEHMATAVLNSFLSNLRNAYRPNENAPSLVVTTPISQLHEVGALIIALVAASEGWRVVYLGPNLPSEEIAAACLQKEAKAVVLSLVYPADDPFIIQELIKLRKLLPDTTNIVIGGRVAENYNKRLHNVPIWYINDIHDFREYLQRIELM